MAKEYIERETALEKVIEVKHHDPELSGVVLHRYIKEIDLKDIPAADVAPVVHGRWIRSHWKNSNYCCDCSECGEEAMHRDYQWDKNGIYPICPNCGAYMTGENNE